MLGKKKSLKPLVIVTGPDKRLKFGWWATRCCLFLVGLRAQYVTAKNAELPSAARGIVIGGGDDIEPEHYGLTGDAGATYDPARDALEMSLLRKALDSKVPILGICRGSQLINVVLGGNLYTDLRPMRKLTPNRNSIFPIKWVDLAPGSHLRKIFGKDAIKINSLHNQAVDRVAESLNQVAHDRDGFIQATETTETDQFVIGVQWHPEYMPYSLCQRKLFKAFATAVHKNQNILS